MWGYNRLLNVTQTQIRIHLLHTEIETENYLNSRSQYSGEKVFSEIHLCRLRLKQEKYRIWDFEARSSGGCSSER